MMGHTMARAEAELVALGSIIGSIVGVLPYLVTLLAAIWYVINIYESTPVQNWFAKRRKVQLDQGKEAALTAIGTAAYKETVGSFPRNSASDADVEYGSAASAKAVNAAKEEQNGHSTASD